MSLSIDLIVHLLVCLSVTLSRCPTSISSRSCVWGGVSRKQWLAFTSCVTGVRWSTDSCCPALFPSLFSSLSFCSSVSPSFQPAAAESSSVCSYVTTAACWFMEHKRLRFDPVNTYTCTHGHTPWQLQHLFLSPHKPWYFSMCICVLCLPIFLSMSLPFMLCALLKTWNWAVTYS